VRHPLYLGTLLVATGFALMIGGVGALVAVCGFLAWFFAYYFPRKERIESARLERLYGPTYAEYQKRVPALRPSLVAWRPSVACSQRLDADRRWSSARYSENNELGAALGVLLCLVAFGWRTVGF
jgi:hypothetical protein